MRHYILAALVGLAIVAPATLAGTAPSERTCFPRAAWSADDGDRPCAQVRRVYEDGSVRVRVTDTDGDRRYTIREGARDR